MMRGVYLKGRSFGRINLKILYRLIVGFPDHDRLQSFLRQKGVETEVYYSVPLHVQEWFQGLGCRPGDIAKVETAAREALALPVYPELTEEQQATSWRRSWSCTASYVWQCPPYF